MPIRAELRPLYPPDWRALSDRIRFERAGGRCEACGRPHGRTVRCLPDGRWRELCGHAWHDGSGQRCAAPSTLADLMALRDTRVVLSTAHLDHNPAHNDGENLRALCQRCHLAHDLQHHRWVRRWRHRLRWAIADLFPEPAPRQCQGNAAST